MVQNAMTSHERLTVTPVHSMMAKTEHWLGVSKEWRTEKCRLGQSFRQVSLTVLARERKERQEAQAEHPMMYYLEMSAAGESQSVQNEVWSYILEKRGNWKGFLQEPKSL